MNSTVAAIFGYGIPIGTVLLMALAAVICIGIAFSFPKHLMFGYVAVLMSFPQSSSYGLLDGESSSVIYVKGTKTFFFSFLDMLIFGTWLVAVVFGRLWQRERRESIPLTKYYLAFGALFGLGNRHGRCLLALTRGRACLRPRPSRRVSTRRAS